MASPPPSPAMPKYKLADYRYGREEMLALYVKESKVGAGGAAGPRLAEKAEEHAYLPPDPQVPDELQDKEFAALLQEEPLQPLALEPLTEEEQVGPGQGSPSGSSGAGVGEVGAEAVWFWTGVARAPGSSLPPLAPSSEKLLPVSEQRGRAEADGERGWAPPRWRLPWQGQHTEPR